MTFWDVAILVGVIYAVVGIVELFDRKRKQDPTRCTSDPVTSR